jgi:hypothetical protein
VFGSKCSGPVAVARGDRGHHDRRIVFRRIDERQWGDPSRAQHPDA